MKRSNTTRSIALVGALLTLWSTALAGTQVRRTITALEPLDGIAANLSGAQAAIYAQPVRVHLADLAEARPLDTLDLNIPGTQHLLATVTRVNHEAPRQFTLKGSLDVDDRSSFILVGHEDVVVGVLRLPATGELYRLRYLGDGVHLMMQIDPALYPAEACFDTTPVAPERPDPTGASSIAAAGESGPVEVMGSCSAPTENIFDVLMPYTNLARQAMGGTNAAIAQCKLAVEAGNESYANSQIDIHLRLVHTMEVTFDESGDQEAWLDWLSWQAVFGAIGTAREEYAADYISMLTAGGSGIGWCGGGEDHAYSCVNWERSVDTWTIVHEMGHNNGCNHNRENRDSGCGTGYEHGWHFYGNSGEHWGSVMSYMGVRTEHFTNPYVYHDGVATGIPIGETNESYTAKVHNDIAPYYRNHRLTRSDIWVDFNRSDFSVQNGTWNEPYNTIQEGLDNIVNGVGASELPNIWFVPANSSFTGTIDAKVQFRVCNGPIQIGVAP